MHLLLKSKNEDANTVTVKILQKISEENQPLPQTIIKGYLLRTAHQKRKLKQRAFSPFFIRLHIGRFTAAPYKSSK